jgi:acetyl-CoA carboxylase carboxyltransferase component
MLSSTLELFEMSYLPTFPKYSYCGIRMWKGAAMTIVAGPALHQMLTRVWPESKIQVPAGQAR